VKTSDGEVDEVPPGSRTVTSTVAEPGGTTAVISVEELTTNDVAGTLPKLTPVAYPKPVPLIVIVAPESAELGLRELTAGGGGIKPSRIKAAIDGLETNPPLPTPPDAKHCELLVHAIPSTRVEFAEFCGGGVDCAVHVAPEFELTSNRPPVGTK